MSVASKKRTGEFKSSDEIIGWIESVAGLSAHIRTEYGGVAELIENPTWDASRSNHAVALLTGLKKEMAELAREFRSHVHGYQKVSR